MDNKMLMDMLMTNLTYIVGGLGVLVIIMYVIIINLYMNLSYLKKRYRKMMAGADGANLERMLIGHIDETKAVVEENARIKAENKQLAALLQKALTRVGVVRFRAFEDMGSDLSFAIALLDAKNNGIVLSGIYARSETRTYSKPIENGASTYFLTEEEKQAIQQAMEKKMEK